MSADGGGDPPVNPHAAASRLLKAPASAFKSKVFRRRLMRRFNRLKTLVAAASGGGEPTVKAMRRAEHAFSAFATFVDGAAAHHRIDGDLANGLKSLVEDGVSALAP